jgi:hypothetical protein
MRPDCPGASRAGSGDWALDCDVSTTMLAASMKDIISVLGMSVAPFVEQPGRAIESRPLDEYLGAQAPTGMVYLAAGWTKLR